MGEVGRATGEVERTGAGVTLRFGTPLPPLQRASVPWYLQKFGYQASDPDRWMNLPTEGTWPNFSLSVKGCYEMLAHTWYYARVSLTTPETDLEPGKSTSWTVPRRLCQFQDGLLEYVNALPTAVYKEHFRGVAFASRGGPFGTVEKLNGWCAALSAAVNSGEVPPFFVARCLRWAEHPTVAVWGSVTDYNREANQDDGAADDKYEHTAMEKIVPMESNPQHESLAQIVESNESEFASEFLEPIQPRVNTDDEAILRAVALAQNKQDAPDIDV